MFLGYKGEFKIQSELRGLARRDYMCPCGSAAEEFPCVSIWKVTDVTPLLECMGNISQE